MPHRLIVSGSAACFRRSDMSIDEVTYDVITPVAARGIFEAIHWTPSISWQVEQIDVLHPIRTRWVEQAGQSRALELVDVRYAIQARFELTAAAGPRDNAGQHVKIFRARARRQQFYRTPYLGRRDLIAEVRLASDDEAITSYHDGRGEVDLGWMPFDRDFAGDHRLLYYRPRMIDGVIDLAAIDREGLPS